MTTPSPLAELSASLADLAAAATPSIVEVQSRHSLASGFVWRDGLVITPDETLADEGSIEIEESDGTVRSATLIGRDAATDIALLRVEGLKAPVAAITEVAVRPGALALVVAAADSAPLIAFGGIAAVGAAWQSMRGGTIDARIELDLRLRRRAEGGLAMDGAGGAFGMAVRGPRGRTLVIPAATIDRVAQQLLAHGRVQIAYLGVGLKDVPLDDGGHGAMVMAIERESPAARAGLHQGDIILSWAGQRMPHVGALLRTLRATPIGTEIVLGVRRGGAPLDVAVTIGDRPER
ncbi:MAG TPA: S1C family serine protease [Sphingomonas sp.]